MPKPVLSPIHKNTHACKNTQRTHTFIQVQLGGGVCAWQQLAGEELKYSNKVWEWGRKEGRRYENSTQSKYKANIQSGSTSLHCSSLRGTCTHKRTAPKLRSRDCGDLYCLFKTSEKQNIHTHFLQFRLSLAFPSVMTHGSAVSIMRHQPDDPTTIMPLLLLLSLSEDPPSSFSFTYLPFPSCTHRRNSLIHSKVNEMVANMSCGPTLLPC